MNTPKREGIKGHFEWEKGNEGHQNTSGSKGTQVLLSCKPSTANMKEINTCWTKFYPRDHHHQAESVRTKMPSPNTVHAWRILHTGGPPADRERDGHSAVQRQKAKSVYMGNTSLNELRKSDYKSVTQSYEAFPSLCMGQIKHKQWKS